MKQNKKASRKPKIKTYQNRTMNMIYASAVAIFIMAVGLYGFLTKSFKEGQVYVELTDGQAIGVLVFSIVASLLVFIYAWCLHD